MRGVKLSGVKLSGVMLEPGAAALTRRVADLRSDADLRTDAVRPRNRLPELALVASLGFAMIVTSYAFARSGQAGSQYLYWTGEAVMFLPIAARVALGRRLGQTEAVGLVLVAALLQFLLMVAYSPLRFSYPDEIAHWQTAADIVRTHHLFHLNYVLPISPRYPGLELITAALSSMSGLSVFAAGLIVAGVAHLLLILAFYALIKAATGSVRLAALACIVYQTNPHYQFWDSFFVYAGVAIPLLLVALLLASSYSGMTVRPTTRAGFAWFDWGSLAVCLGIVATVVVSHHVTALILVGVLVLLVAFRLAAPRQAVALEPDASVMRLLGTTVAAIVFTALWIAFVAPQTFQYLSPVVSSITQGVSGLFSHAGTAAPAPGPANPPANQLLSYAMTGLVALAVPYGAWRIIRERRSGLATFLALAAFTYYAAIVVRLVSTNGAELTGRALTYIYFPVSLAVAVTIVRLCDSRLPRWASSAILVASLAVLFFGALSSGWPPSWERLPGGYQVSGIDRSVSAPDLAVAQWFGRDLPPGGRAAVDLVDYALVGAIGRQDVIRNGGPLFFTPIFDAVDAALVQRSSVRYVVVDQRLAGALPASGRYFPDDPLASRRRAPIPLAALQKYNLVRGVSRIYDNGAIQVYDLSTAAGLP